MSKKRIDRNHRKQKDTKKWKWYGKERKKKT